MSGLRFARIAYPGVPDMQMWTFGAVSTAAIASRQRSCRPPWPSTICVPGCRRASTASWSGVENGGVPSWKRIGIPSAPAVSQTR